MIIGSGITIGSNITIGDFPTIPYLSSSLYEFSTFTFQTANNVGPRGPTLGNLYSYYSNVGNTWIQSTDNFTVLAQGYQVWTVPQTGTYEIEAAGSRSGLNQYAGNGFSYGSIVRGRFTLNQGDKITMVVGQPGNNTVTNNSYGGAGGGGGTFVVLGNVVSGANSINISNAAPLIIGGGGGGWGRWTNWLSAANLIGANGATTTSGTNSAQANYTGAAGGTNGWGGNSHVAANGAVSSNSYDSGGGGGYLLGGVNGTGANARTNITNTNSGGGGQAFANLAIGGVAASSYIPQATPGGFGGGGGGTPIAGGGGGGYSGGGGAWSSAATSSDGGGGGGSFINANATVVATSDGNYNAASTFGGQSITSIGSFNANAGYVRITRI
jgi:hypothetical protein